MNTKTYLGIGALIIVVGAVFLFAHPGPSTSQGQLVGAATYQCSTGTTIAAQYYQGASQPATSAGGPPTPGGSVVLKLSDGRSMTLPQTISADGARYANADESVVFWNKGNGITFTENGQQTYMGCIAVAADPGGLPQTYENGTEGFSIRYPADYSVDEAYSYQELGPGKDIGGIKFTIPASVATGTNLAADSYVSVEEVPQAQTCSASLFLDQRAAPTTVTDGSTTYSVATSSDAGAGNRYEETVYALPGTNPCIAVRYFIHYGAIENYPAGAVQQFDKQALLSQFDAIRRSLVVAQ